MKIGLPRVGLDIRRPFYAVGQPWKRTLATAVDRVRPFSPAILVAYAQNVRPSLCSPIPFCGFYPLRRKAVRAVSRPRKKARKWEPQTHEPSSQVCQSPEPCAHSLPARYSCGAAPFVSLLLPATVSSAP